MHSETGSVDDALRPEHEPIALDAEGLACRRGGREVLHGVDVHVAAGEVIGILGPNGSGKSTFLSACCGLLPLDAGQVRLGDRPLGDWPPPERARRVALLPQEPPVPFQFTTREVALLGRHPHQSGAGWADDGDLAVVDAALDSCGIAHLASRPIGELSAGERQRVHVARTLAQRPGLLLLDEPATFLDFRHEARIYAQVRAAAVRGAAVAIVLHDLQVAASLCDRAMLLCDGRVVATGATDDVLTAESLGEAFDAAVDVHVDGATGRRWIGIGDDAAWRPPGRR